MKKIISLLLATMMMVSFSAVASANSITITGTNAEVEKDATDANAKVDVTFTIDLPTAASLLSFDIKLQYDKTALTLNEYKVNDDLLAFNLGYSNLGLAEGAQLSFTDESYAGTTASKQYSITCNFTVNDAATVKTHDIAVLNWEATDASTFSTVEGCGAAMDYTGIKSTISVVDNSTQETTTTSYFGANVNTADKPSLAQILVYTFTTDQEGVANKTATREINLGTNFESATTIKTAAKVSGIPEGVNVGCSVAWKPWD